MPEVEPKPLALALPSLPASSYRALDRWGGALACAFERLFAGKRPLIAILMKDDAGMALGQILQRKLADSQSAGEIVVIDGLEADEGDFVEIGAPLPGGFTLPVSMKTLLFPEL